MTYSVAAWCLLPNWTWRAAARQNASPAATWNQTYIYFWFNASVSSHRFNLTYMATLCGCKFLFVALSKSCTEKTKKKKPGQQIRKAFSSLHWHENIIFQKWLPLLLISCWRRMFGGKLYTFTSFMNQQDSPAHFFAILNMLAALTKISAASSTLVELPL